MLTKTRKYAFHAKFHKNIKILDITTDDADIEDVYLGLTKN